MIACARDLLNMPVHSSRQDHADLLGFWLVSFLVASALGSRMLPVARFTTVRKYRMFFTTSFTGKCI